MSETVFPSTEFQITQDLIGVESIWNEIKEAVNSTPTMVFSVIGDSENFVSRPWQTTAFQTALIEAAKSGGDTWILYLGLENGVSKVISDAYRSYVNLKCPSKSGSTLIDDVELHIKLISFAGRQIQKAISKTKGGDTEGFLLDLEVFVSKQKAVFSMPVPIAVIVCEGNIGTIAHISDALEENIPVIIMKGSGKAADLVSDYLDNPLVLQKKIGTLLGIGFNESMHDKLTKYLQRIGQKRHLVGIFDLDRDDPLMLSNIVGETIVSSWSMENITQSNTNDNFQINQKNKDVSSLALNFLLRNTINPTKETVYQLLEEFKQLSMPCTLNEKYLSPSSLPLYFYFGHQLLEEMGLIEECGPVLLLEALKANRCDYVKVLLNQGVAFDIKYLPELYDQVVSCQHCVFKEDCPHLNSVLKQMKKNQQSLKNTMNGEKKNEAEDLSFSVADLAKRLCRKLLQYNVEEIKTKRSPQDESISNILLWAILANRMELAKIYWVRGKDQFLTGLVCSAVLKELSRDAENIKEQILANELKEHSKLFEQRCILMMNDMCEENTNQAMDLIDSEAVIWGIVSCPLHFAYEHFLYDVLAHMCSQKYINKRWYNNLSPNLGQFLKSAIHEPIQFLTAPLTKYIINSIFFFVMLIMYSGFVLTSISKEYDDRIFTKVSMFYVYVWSIGDVAEEVTSFFGGLDPRGLSYRSRLSRLKRYLQNFWNVADLLSYVFLMAALIERELANDVTFNIPRRMYALSLIFMFLRSLKAFLVHKNMGPTLIMIKEMVKDLLTFLFIAVIVMLSVGIYYYANLCPDDQNIWNGWGPVAVFWVIFLFPYWQLYGELSSSFIYGVTPLACNRHQPDWSVPVVAAIYVLFSNILLVNLVIAKFSYTFERVQENAGKLWSFEMYTMVNDYKWRIPSPINLLFVIPRFFYFSKICKKTKVSGAPSNNRIREYQRDFQKTTALRISSSTSS